MRTYFNLLATCFLIVSVAIFACNKQNFNANTDLSGLYTIGHNQTVNLPTGRKMAALTLTAIADNRCPINADCIDAGSAVVTVKFKDRNSEQTKELCLGTCLTMMQTIHPMEYNTIYL
jgi:hypothetical protein